MADDGEGQPSKGNESPIIELKRDRHGWPALPSLEEIQGRSLTYKKRLIGKFMTDVYGS